MERHPHDGHADVQERFLRRLQRLDYTITAQMDFFSRSRERYDLSDVTDGEALSIVTETGTLEVVRPKEAKLYDVLASDLPDLAAGDKIQLHGASMGGAVSLQDTIGQGCSLSYSKLTSTFLTPHDYAAMDPASLVRARESGFVQVDNDNREYITPWDQVHRHTPAVEQVYIGCGRDIRAAFEQEQAA